MSGHRWFVGDTISQGAHIAIVVARESASIRSIDCCGAQPVVQGVISSPFVGVQVRRWRAPMTTAASKTRAKKLVPRLTLSVEKGNEIVGVLLFAIVVLLAGALLSYHPDDPSLFRHTTAEATQNLIGPFGANVAALMFGLIGLAALAVPVVIGVSAWRHVKRRIGDHTAERMLGLGLLLVALPSLLDLLLGEVAWRAAPMRSGGAWGYLVADGLDARLNFGGAFVVLLSILLIGGTLAVRSTLGASVVTLRARAAQAWAWLQLQRSRRQDRKEKADTRTRVVNRHLERAGRTASAPLPPVRVKERKGEGHFAVRKVPLSAAPPVTPEAEVPTAPTPRKRQAPASRKAKTAKAPAPQVSLGFAPDEFGGTELPPVNLLEMGRADNQRDESELVREGETIQQACKEFNVDGSIAGISPGPVITVFEFQPAPGVKVSRIVGLQDDLALAMKAESVRIDRMPGRSTLGIEVPNRRRNVIHLGGLLAESSFGKAKSPLTMAIGVDIYGRPVYSDLATMPHLLVAGATGAGKSVGLQSMITSVLYKASKEEVKFIFIDPKRIELGVYADIPHLKTEVVVEPQKAANALRWAVSEMERRYRLLAEVHVRSIAFYNQAIRDPSVRDRLALGDGESEITYDDLKPLPYYVIIIDELADLMMVASSDVETSIARLAQMARAVGIHLIVATQRPSVDVLTGTIKANFPCRLAYATATRHDSRTILDQVGAEKLLGKGDALFMPPGTSRIMRLHGAYISEQETASLIRWLKKRGKPDLDPEVVKAQEEKGGSKGGGGGHDDELYDEAARLVVSEGMGSASFLQRRMRVGFSRAARLIDMMADDGILGPSQGSKPREVLVKPDFFDELDRTRMD